MKPSVIAAGVLAIFLATPSRSQETSKGDPMAASHATKVTATVEKIDAANRVLTLKGPEGNVVDVSVSPAVKRFDQIKVGDRLFVTYTESLVIGVAKADATSPLGMSYEESTKPAPGEKPAGVIARRVRATVAVEKVDIKAATITVHTSDGSTEIFHVKDTKRLEGVNPGDKITITYEDALAISVKAPNP
jgi:Cu/Ag efflux protein CusF